MKPLKLTIATLFFVSSITIEDQVLKTSQNVLVSNWSVSFGIQTSYAVRYLAEQSFDTVNFE